LCGIGRCRLRQQASAAEIVLQEIGMAKTYILGLFALTLVLTGCASSGAGQPSPHFSDVAKHLDVGGQLLVYGDVEGDLSSAAAEVDRAIARLAASYPAFKLQPIHAKHIVEQLGLDQIVAFGLSSKRDGKIFHNKSFLKYGHDRRGILLLTEAPPHEIEIARQAPANIDLGFESDLKIKSLLALVEAIAKDAAGEQAIDLFSGLDTPLWGTSLKLRTLLDRLDTRLVGVLRVDERRSFVWPDTKLTVPSVDLLLSLDDVAILFDALESLAHGLPGIHSGVDGDFHFLEIDPPIPGANWLRPVLAKNSRDGRVFLATSKDFIKEYWSPKTDGKAILAQAPDFKRATTGFERKANGLSYVSAGFVPKLTRFLRPLGTDDPQRRAGTDYFLDLLGEAAVPMAAEQVNLPDGLLTLSNLPLSHKSTIIMGMAALPTAVTGALVAAYTSGLLRAAHASKHAQRPPMPPAIEDEIQAPAADFQSPVVPLEFYKVERLRVPPGGPSRGAASPTVTIVEFSDFECSYCAQIEQIMEKLLRDYPDDVRISFRHFPLTSHPNAALAAEAAMAADAQGKFWPMHHALMAHQQHLERAALEAYAQQAGLDVERFKQALDRHDQRATVEADRLLAAELEVSVAPTFFVNGRPIIGAEPYETFRTVVDDEVAQAKEIMEFGTPRNALYETLMAQVRVSTPLPEAASKDSHRKATRHPRKRK
jgi:protein-disulfide isomerase